MTTASTVPMVAERMPRMKVFFSASWVDDSSKKTKWKLWRVKLSNEMNCEASRENAALKSAAYGKKTGHISTVKTRPTATHWNAPSLTSRGSPCLPPTTE